MPTCRAVAPIEAYNCIQASRGQSQNTVCKAKNNLDAFSCGLL